MTEINVDRFIQGMKAAGEFPSNDPTLLKLTDSHSGSTVAHYQADQEWTTEDKEILLLENDEGSTVAHNQANGGWTTEDKEILKLDNDYGSTVAHYQAAGEWVTYDVDLLKLEDCRGRTVCDIILNRLQADDPKRYYIFVKKVFGTKE